MAVTQPTYKLSHKLYNSLLALLAAVGLEKSLDANQLLQRSQRAIGLDDLANDEVAHWLEQLCNSLNREAKLSAVGRRIIHSQLYNRLISQRQVSFYCRQHPNVAKQTVTAPIFILGHNASQAATLAQLLALDSKHRTPLYWEVDDPYPPPNVRHYLDDKRINLSQTSLQQHTNKFRFVTPFWPASARNSAPCEHILSNVFFSSLYLQRFLMPSYQQWLQTQNPEPALIYQKQLLQYLSAEFPSRRWILWSTMLAGHIEHLLAVYPDAKFIILQDKSEDILLHQCEQLAMTRAVYSHAGNAKAIGLEQLQYLHHLQQHAKVGSRKVSAGNLITLAANNLQTNPVQSIQKLYQQLDILMDNDTLEQLKMHAKEQLSASRKVQSKLADFGLSSPIVEQRLGNTFF